MAYRVNFYDERAWGLVVSPISPADQLTYEFYLPEDEMVYWQVTSSNPPIVIKTEPFTAVVNDVIGLGSDPCQDQDGDGYGYHASLACTKPLQDCDDNNSNIHPRAEEICDDGVDNDCDGLVDLMSGLEDPDCETQ
jgi:hypothetical protein